MQFGLGGVGCSCLFACISSLASPTHAMLQGKMIKAAKAEALTRRVLQSTPPGLFQHMMRTINSQVKRTCGCSVACDGQVPGRCASACWVSAPVTCLQTAMALFQCVHPLRCWHPACPGAGAAGHQAQRLRRPGPAHHVLAGPLVSTLSMLFHAVVESKRSCLPRSLLR